MGSKYGKMQARWTSDEFKTLPLDFRVPAVLSDGQYYTADKVRSMCLEKREGVVQPIIDKLLANGEITRHSNGESYYMTLKQLEKWRSEHGIAVDDQIIPKLVSTRIFGDGPDRMTENELFDSAPIHQVGTVTFTLRDPDMMSEIIKELGWMGKFKIIGPGRCKLYCLSANIARRKLVTFDEQHGGDVFEAGHLTSHNSSYRRELCELPKKALFELAEYYIRFTPKLVPYLKKTFETYSGNGPGENNANSNSPDAKAEMESVLLTWILDLVQKYNESRGFPFSVYVQTAIPRFISDYANAQIGGDLNKFQMEKNGAIKRLNERNRANGNYESDRYYAPETIRKEMASAKNYRLSAAEYRKYDNELDLWKKSKYSKQLDWDETGEQKSFETYDPKSVETPFSDPRLIEDMESKSHVQRALLQAGLDTGDWDTTVKAIRMLTDTKTLASIIIDGSFDVTDEYRDALAKALSKISSVGIA